MTSVFLRFLYDNRKTLGLVLGAVLLAVFSFSLGRYGVAERVVFQERVQVVEVIHEVVVETEKIVDKKVFVKDERQKIHREETTTSSPDGTVVVQKTEDINIDSHTRDVEVREVEKQVVVEKEVEKIVEKEVLVDKTKPMTDWRISPMAGVNGPELPGLLGGDGFDVLRHLVVGAKVERRIYGPASVGVWALSTGQAGLSVSLDF